MSRLTPGIVAAIMVSGSVIYMAANRLKQPGSSLSRLCKDFKLVSIASASEDSPKPLPKPKKKVRFSDTVVELRAGADELAPRLRRAARENENKSSDKNREQNPEKSQVGILTMTETEGHIIGNKIQPQADDLEPQLSKSRISKKVAALLGGNLPANRLALYCNMYHDRLLKV